MKIYRFVLTIVSPIIIFLILKENIKRGFSLTFLLQRLGYQYPSFPQNARWIHCASVGELNAVTALIALVEQPVILTVGTTSAYQLGQTLSEKITVCALPFDWVASIKRFLKCAQPNSLWVVETEIWPQLFKQCACHKIPISIISARITNKIIQAPEWLKNYYRQSLALVDKVLAKDANNAMAFQNLGVPEQQCQPLGNLKYSHMQPKEYPTPSKRPYVLLASSHTDEEVEFVAEWLKNKRSEQFIIAPRHPERTKTILKNLQLQHPSLTISRGRCINDQTDVHIVDELGQLMPLFQHAIIVIMGGSFVEKGGHNVLEPISYGAAVITGKDMSNFLTETQSLLQENVLIQCSGYDEAMKQVLHLLTNATLRQEIKKQALQHFTRRKDLAQKYVEALTNV